MDTINSVSYTDYLSSGFIPLLCKGYHLTYNPRKDYETAKEPVSSGWTRPEYQPTSLNEIEVWEKAGGWPGWAIPKGVIALDVEDPDEITRVRKICQARSIQPGIHQTNNGLHSCFLTNLDLPASSTVFTKCGIKVTYRVGGKNYLILAPTNGRRWELWKGVEALPTLPDDFLKYDRRKVDEVLNCLSWAVRRAYREGYLSGYEDLDAAFMALLIGCRLAQEQIQRAFEDIFGQDYDERRTHSMLERTREKIETGEPLIGAGSFMLRVREQGLKEIDRFGRELQTVTGGGRVAAGEDLGNARNHGFSISDAREGRTGSSLLLTDDAPWPSPMAEEAFYGLAGEVVKIIEPQSEADPVALLIQCLTATGNVIGSNAYFQVEADKHNLKIFSVLVGETSKARKGTSWGHIKKIFSEVDPTWGGKRIKSGLSSGEGLVWQVRDEISRKEPIRERGRVTGEYQDVIEDQGELDKRLLIIEAEFASTLRVIGRDGNNLSPLIRQAWDDGNLQTLTKNKPVKSTGAHISAIGHITKDELRRYLDRTETGNGFANRFIWLCVKRSKALPEGGSISDLSLRSIVDGVKGAIEFGRNAGEIRKDAEAKEIWASIYQDLSDGKPGLFGAVTSRAEAQVMRLACVYAVLDRSSYVRRGHLLAALAVWDYAEASARYIFGDSTGNPIADRILASLKQSPSGLGLSEIHDLFSRHEGKPKIQAALNLLEKFCGVQKDIRDTGGGRLKSGKSEREMRNKRKKGEFAFSGEDYFAFFAFARLFRKGKL